MPKGICLLLGDGALAPVEIWTYRQVVCLLHNKKGMNMAGSIKEFFREAVKEFGAGLDGNEGGKRGLFLDFGGCVE